MRSSTVTAERLGELRFLKLLNDRPDPQ